MTALLLATCYYIYPTVMYYCVANEKKSKVSKRNEVNEMDMYGTESIDALVRCMATAVNQMASMRFCTRKCFVATCNCNCCEFNSFGLVCFVIVWQCGGRGMHVCAARVSKDGKLFFVHQNNNVCIFIFAPFSSPSSVEPPNWKLINASFDEPKPEKSTR